MADDPVTVVKLAPGPDQRFQALRRELGVQSFGMNLITLQPGQRGRVHRHERQEEVYLVLEGELALLVEGQQWLLGPHEIARVSAEVRRQLVNRSSAPVVIVALGGAGEHESRDGVAWESWQEAGPGRPPQEVPLPEDLPVG